MRMEIIISNYYPFLINVYNLISLSVFFRIKQKKNK